MNIRYKYNEIEFEWDSSKASTNVRKYRVSFETACEVFFDPFVCVGDEQVIDGEVRDTAIGMTVEWQLLYVAYPIRGETIPLISARMANSYQRKFMKINKLKERLRKERPMTTISLRMPQDVVDDLKRIAPYLGFSGYQPLMRAYIGQGLRKDLARLEQTPQVTYLLDSLRRQGIGDEVLVAALAEMTRQVGKQNESIQESTKRDTRVEKILAEESIEYDPTAPE